MTTCPNELFDCANCFHQGALDQHLRCENCGSDAVMPVAVFGNLDSEEIFAHAG